MRDRPTWDPIWLACKACGHQWDGWQPSMVPARTWIAHAKTHCCPSCGKGGRTVLLRATPLATPPEPSDNE